MSFWKKYIKVTIIVLLIILGAFIYLDQGTGRQTDNGLLPSPDSPHEEKPLLYARVISGKIVQYGANRMGDIDKIMLQTFAGQMWLHFPPHTAKKVLEIAQQNAMVKAEADQNNEAYNDKPMGELLSLESENQRQKIFIKDIPPPTPSTGIETEITGTSTELQTDEQGHAVGFILSGKLVELNPKMSQALSVLLQRAKLISVKGVARSAGDGFVNAKGLVLVKPVTINIDNINYVVQ